MMSNEHRRSSSGSLVWEIENRNPFDKYERVALLAKASSANNNNRVRHIVSKKTTGEQYYMKSIRIGSTLSGAETVKAKKQLRNEIKILRKLDHPNIVRVYETYNHAGSVYMISEYVEGDFVLKQGQRDEETAAKLVGQLLSAVRYLHDRNIVHGDLQSNHIIVSSPGNTLTVVGFASSRHYHESGHAPSGPTNQKTTHTFFAAPETVKSGTITPKSDLWSVGVIAHALVIGSLPFKRAHDFNQFVCSPSGGGKLDFSGFEWDSISDEAREFLQSLVEVDPAQRLDSHEAQRNAWIKNYYKKPSEKDIDRDLLKRVAKHFKQRVRKDSLFRKAALMIIARTTHHPMMKELIKAFNFFDKHKSGVITFKEFQRVMIKLPRVDEDLILKIFVSMDINEDTTVHYSEFLGAALECVFSTDEDGMLSLPQTQIKEAFERMDTNQSGFIDEDDMLRIFDVTEEQAQKIMDSSELAQVDYEAFLGMISEVALNKYREEQRMKRQREMAKLSRNLQRHRSEPARNFRKDLSTPIGAHRGEAKSRRRRTEVIVALPLESDGGGADAIGNESERSAAELSRRLAEKGDRTVADSDGFAPSQEHSLSRYKRGARNSSGSHQKLHALQKVSARPDTNLIEIVSKSFRKSAITERTGRQRRNSENHP